MKNELPVETQELIAEIDQHLERSREQRFLGEIAILRSEMVTTKIESDMVRIAAERNQALDTLRCAGFDV